MESTSGQEQTHERLGQKLSDFIFEDGVDLKSAQDAWQRIEGELSDILTDFYSHIQKTPDLAAKLGTEPGKIQNLKKAQTSHWEYVLTHAPDLEFEGQALRIGEAHVRADLSVQWYLASYGKLIRTLIPVLMNKHRLAPQKAAKSLQALISHFFIDMILSVDAFSGGQRRVREEKQKEMENLQNLRNLASTVINVNNISLDMAVLSRNTRKATDSGQAISAAVTQLVSSTEQISDNSEKTAALAQQTNETVAEGLSVMNTASSAISNMADASTQTAQSLSDLQQAAEQISGFLSVIESISSQTNLLALNATIEAARAGQAGKGFAVVASEVKELATQAAKATDDISDRINALTQGMKTIQGAIEGSQEAVSHGQEAISGANGLMEQIGTQVSEVSHSMQEVASILGQQTEASQEIAKSVTGVADLSSENEVTLSEMVGALQESNDQFSNSAGAWFEGNSHRSLCEMAKIDHILFKKRVVDTVMGRGDWKASEVPDHHSCRLGKWYDGINNPHICAHSVFKSLVEPHERVHEAAKRTLEHHANQDYEATFECLKEVDVASKEVLEELENLSQALDSELAHADKRGHVRFAESSTARITTDHTNQDLEVTDLSKTGMGVKGLDKNMIGRTLEVQVKDAKHLAQAVWSDGDRAGLRFLSGDS
ncbi:MAG: methyl-accepting chemotaxis protein [Cohaesibacter sp.]|nr:methyl-accepting chemotaxis protein [Cohaesibacter sp.]